MSFVLSAEETEKGIEKLGVFEGDACISWISQYWKKITLENSIQISKNRIRKIKNWREL